MHSIDPVESTRSVARQQGQNGHVMMVFIMCRESAGTYSLVESLVCEWRLIRFYCLLQKRMRLERMDQYVVVVLICVSVLIDG